MSKKILIVDDDKGTIRLVEELLTSRGYEVVSLDHPKFVYKTIRNERPDLVLLDIIMPYKDGYRVCEEIKSTFNESIPVILFTSQPYEKEFIKESYKDFKADDYMIKPFKANDLLTKIEQYLKKEE